VLDIIRKIHSTVFAHLINSEVRLGKIRISKGANGNRYYPWRSVQQMEDSGAAFRAEVKPSHAALVPDEHIFCALAFNRNLVGGKPGLSTEHAADPARVRLYPGPHER
jgi:hypothetical protein